MSDYDEDDLSNKYDDDLADYSYAYNQTSDTNYFNTNTKVKKSTFKVPTVAPLKSELDKVFEKYKVILDEKFAIDNPSYMYGGYNGHARYLYAKGEFEKYLVLFKENLGVELLAEREIEKADLKKAIDEAASETKPLNRISKETDTQSNFGCLQTIAILITWLVVHVACTTNVKSCAVSDKNTLIMQSNLSYSCH